MSLLQSQLAEILDSQATLPGEPSLCAPVALLRFPEASVPPNACAAAPSTAEAAPACPAPSSMVPAVASSDVGGAAAGKEPDLRESLKAALMGGSMEEVKKLLAQQFPDIGLAACPEAPNKPNEPLQAADKANPPCGGNASVPPSQPVLPPSELQSIDAPKRVSAEASAPSTGVRLTLPGPSLPMDSTPENVGKFVDKWMKRSAGDATGRMPATPQQHVQETTPSVSATPQQQQETTPSVPETPEQQQETTPSVPATPQQQPNQQSDITTTDLQAMGWQLPDSCRPQTPQTVTTETPQPVTTGTESKELPPTAPATPAVKQEANENTTPAVTKPAPESKESGGEMSRRAAANLVVRLKSNPSRLEGLGSLKKMVFDEKQKSQLITLLQQHNGSLPAVQTALVISEESGKMETSRKQALRFTKKQMQDMYGDEADKVMRGKELGGMTEEDENNPGSIVYLVAQKIDEDERYKRSSSFGLMRGTFKLDVIFCWHYQSFCCMEDIRKPNFSAI